MTARKPQHPVRVRRVYDDAEPGAGVRVLVDRIWPRGLRKDEARIDRWCKAVAPSTELRTWYHHDPDRFGDFARRYRAELREPDRAEALAELRALVADGPVTLLTASKAVEISQATVLAELLRR
jgi:uncharacterized protein YeaO (DUF488 family)